MQTLCTTFRILAAQTWALMNLNASTKILLREDGITALNLQQLVHLHPSEILIRDFTPIEESSTTGADWEWWIFGDNCVYGAAVQAKRLNNNRYDIGYVPKNKYPQINRLLDYCSKKNISPMYCFYNWWSNGNIPSHWASGATPKPSDSLGCTLADGWAIYRHHLSGIYDAVSLARLSEPWSWMVCCPNGEDPARRALRVYSYLANITDRTAVAEMMTNRPRPEPVIHPHLPEYVAEAWRLASLGRREDAAERMGENAPKRIVLSGRIPREFRLDGRYDS